MSVLLFVKDSEVAFKLKLVVSVSGPCSGPGEATEGHGTHMCMDTSTAASIFNGATSPSSSTCLPACLTIRPTLREVSDLARDPVAGRVTFAPSEPGVKCTGGRSGGRWRNLLSLPRSLGTGPLGSLIHDNWSSRTGASPLLSQIAIKMQSVHHTWWRRIQRGGFA